MSLRADVSSTLVTVAIILVVAGNVLRLLNAENLHQLESEMLEVGTSAVARPKFDDYAYPGNHFHNANIRLKLLALQECALPSTLSLTWRSKKMDRVLFTLASFLRICQMDTGQQIAAIERKLNPSSSYDFYHSLNRAIRARVAGKSGEEIEDILLSPGNAAEREYNLAAYRSFEERYARKRGIEIVRQKCTYKVPKSAISIICDPLFSTTEDGALWIHSIWAARTPPLQNKYGAVGCMVLRECYRTSNLANSVFAIANLTDGKRIGEKSISNATPAILRSDAGTLTQLISEVL